jgi:sigma-B regulation protein RsbU (phosphoserine phosphatase)
MKKINLFRVKNALLFANGISNTFGILVIGFIHKHTGDLITPEVLLLIKHMHMFFLPLSFIVPIVITVAYERPIRRYLEKLYRNEPVSKEFTLQARQRLLNEPFFLIVLDFLIWLAAGCVYSGMLWLDGADRMSIGEAFFQNIFTGIITVTVAFFVLEFVFQRRVVKYFFPKGGLSTTARTFRIRIRTRLMALLLAINIVPMMAIYGDVSKIFTPGIGVHPYISQLEKAIKIEVLIFVCIGIWVVFLVSSNLTKPFKNIIQVLQNVKKGNFSSRVQVTSNDEIGYTGDTINEMTQGLMERDRIQQSLYMAKEIQQNLVPRKNVKINGLDMAGRSVYCDETGGDYYDFIPMAGQSDSKTGVAIGDVSGHGVSSAILMATVRASLRQRASLPGGIAEMISDVNYQLARDVAYSGDFMTLFFLVIDTLRGRLEWVRAGHDPAMIYTPENDTFQELVGPGMALGVKADGCYEVDQLQGLSKGQIILLGTDGIWEAQNRKGSRMGKDPVYDVIREHAAESAPDILQAVFDCLETFQQGAKREDDITAVIVKIEALTASSPLEHSSRVTAGT